MIKIAKKPKKSKKTSKITRIFGKRKYRRDCFWDNKSDAKDYAKRIRKRKNENVRVVPGRYKGQKAYAVYVRKKEK